MDDSAPRRLDSGARGGLGGLIVVAAVFVALVLWQSTAPIAGGAAMAALGAVAVALAWHTARRRRRHFSAVQWFLLSGLLLACFLLLRATAGPALARHLAEDPSRGRTVLILVAVLAAVGLVSLWMLREKRKEAE